MLNSPTYSIVFHTHPFLYIWNSNRLQMKKILLILLTLPLFAFGQENNLYHIPDTNFLAFLQGMHPEVIVNDSLDVTTASVLTSLFCTNREIESLDGLQYFTSLTSLNCGNNQLAVLPLLPLGLSYLNLQSNQFTVLPELPDGLTSLNCRSNQLTVLPELPGGLTILVCSYNQLTVLPELPNGLTEFSCYSNQLTVLPELPNGLTELNCHSNQLTVLPELPDGLTEFSCYSNQLTVLPELPDGLTSLLCRSNQLTVLPELPNGLTEFSCYSNQLTVLPELPNGLTEFSCYSNQLTVLPELPDGLTSLYCFSNQLTVLPELPNGLTLLDCFSNQFTVLPDLPVSLTTLNVDYDELVCVQYFPEQLDWQLGGAQICIEGCKDSTYYNYSDTVQVDDGSCISFQYMVDSLSQLNANALDTISGLQVELETWNSSIELSEGWNMVGYGCPTATDLVVAMYAYEDFILIMKDNNGQVYMPEYGFNGIGDLTPGYGYQLKVNDYILDFNICE